jgi:hypothetical protein
MVWIVVAVLAVLLIVAGVLLWRTRRSQQLREGFGPEYDRTVAEHGDRRAAESELLERRERREKLDVQDLEPTARERYAERWRATQRRFVDEPAQVVAEADELIKAVMRDRGYPVEDDFERRAADISVDHPVVVEHYREAHAISTDSARGDAETEDLRQAMVHFRVLFAELVGEEDGRSDEARHDVKEMS